MGTLKNSIFGIFQVAKRKCDFRFAPKIGRCLTVRNEPLLLALESSEC